MKYLLFAPFGMMTLMCVYFGFYYYLPICVAGLIVTSISLWPKTEEEVHTAILKKVKPIKITKWRDLKEKVKSQNTEALVYRSPIITYAPTDFQQIKFETKKARKAKPAAKKKSAKRKVKK